MFNDFDVSDSLAPTEKIELGGPGRDGIPSIDKPKFITVKEADYLEPLDVVMSVTFGGETRAYPHRILNLHEIVNDRIGTNSFVVTYCPLCGSGMVFDRRYGDEELDFGVSGLLYQSDVLMYDRQSESLWSQLMMKSISGKKKGEKLKHLPSERMTFAAWALKYPEGKVLSTDTGHERSYRNNPYAGYEHKPTPLFDVGHIRDELASKSWVIGFLVGEKAYAVPIDRVSGGKSIKLELGGREISVSYDAEKREPTLTDGKGGPHPFTLAYWFAWQAFHRDTVIVPQG